MTKSELRSTLLLSLILSFRMLGLFMILPVFSLYAGKLEGTTPTLIGVALGIYGFTQASLQMPLGMISDKLGRKPIIVAGLLIFTVGSVIAAASHSILGVIIGRAVQGSGAIGSTVMAYLADLTRSENRTKAMAIAGMTIGISFAIAMVLGPLLNSWIEVSGIFWITALLALFGIVLLTAAPSVKKIIIHPEAEPVVELFKPVFFNTNLMRLNIGIAILHAVLTACFIVVPFLLVHDVGINSDYQWLLYLGVLIAAFLLISPAIIYSEKSGQMRYFFNIAIIILAISSLLFWVFRTSLIGFTIALLLFFTAITFLEACLPSLISKAAPLNRRGTAIGIYSTFQYSGIFLGGIVGGLLFEHLGAFSVFAACAFLALIWLIVANGIAYLKRNNTMDFKTKKP